MSPSSSSALTKPRRGLDWSFWVVALLSCGSAAWVIAHEGWAVAREVATDDFILFLQIIPKVIAGTLIGALVRLLVPRHVIVAWLGAGSGLKGLTVASLAGVLIPAGPFTVFPLAASFLTAGADAGAAVAFITGWLLLGLNRAVVWELPFFGVAFVGLRMATSCWVPIAAGMLARRLSSQPWFANPHPQIATSEREAAGEAEPPR